MGQRYRPAKGRANWATAFLVIHGVISVAFIISNIAEIGLLQRLDNGQLCLTLRSTLTTFVKELSGYCTSHPLSSPPLFF